ncbi:MAG: phage portal protein [Pseudomonadota bacterium]
MRILGFDIDIRRGSEHRNSLSAYARGEGHVFVEGGSESEAGQTVTLDSALSVPAVWCAVNFLAGTLAALPMEVRLGDRVEEGNPLTRLLNDAPNDHTTAFDFRFWLISQVLTCGRGFALIRRRRNGMPVEMFALESHHVSVDEVLDDTRPSGVRRVYRYNARGRSRTFEAGSIVDIAYQLKPDRLNHYDPLHQMRDVLGMALAARAYGAKAFQSGGVPPVVLEGPFQSGKGVTAAANDIFKAMLRLARQKFPVMVLPGGHKLMPLGFNAKDMQLVELQRHLIEEVARVYQLPPVFLQMLSSVTYGNAEQQDMHLVKHTLRRWVDQIEDELSLKLFGPRGRRRVAFNLDGLLRGDFAGRMAAYAQAISSGQMTPNEARGREGRPALDGGDQLLIQGAMVPINQAARPGAVPEPAPTDQSGDDAPDQGENDDGV